MCRHFGGLCCGSQRLAFESAGGKEALFNDPSFELRANETIAGLNVPANRSSRTLHNVATAVNSEA